MAGGSAGCGYTGRARAHHRVEPALDMCSAFAGRHRPPAVGMVGPTSGEAQGMAKPAPAQRGDTLRTPAFPDHYLIARGPGVRDSFAIHGPDPSREVRSGGEHFSMRR